MSSFKKTYYTYSTLNNSERLRTSLSRKLKMKKQNKNTVTLGEIVASTLYPLK